MARPRPLIDAYRDLRARYRAKSAALSLAYRQIRELQKRLDMEELNGMAIMAARDEIERRLGVNSVVIPGLNITSPFFDDIVGGLVDTILILTRKVQNLQQRVSRHITGKRAAALRRQSQFHSQLQAQNAVLQQAAAQWAQQQSAQQQMMMTNSTTAAYPTGSMLSATSGGITTWTNTTGSLYFVANGGSSGLPQSTQYIDPMPLVWTEQTLEIRDGQRRRVLLPDGAVIEVEPDGSYRIDDADAKVIYRASRIREFNRYINASDLLREFIKFCGDSASVTRHEMLDLPIKLFIGYLVLEAAKADGEPEPDDVRIVSELEQTINPPCAGCGAQLSAERRSRHIRYCGCGCFEAHERQTLQCEAA